MFGRSVHSRKPVYDEDVRGSRLTTPRGGFRLRLPSPFVLFIIVVFVILPLVWPESDNVAMGPDLLAAYDLSTDVCALAVSPDARRMAASCRDSSIVFWQRVGEHEWSPSRLPKHRAGGARCLAFSPDAETLVAGNFDGTISLWDATSGVPLATFETGAEIVCSIAVSPDGRTLATAGSDSRVLLWDLAGRKVREALEGHDGPINAVAFSPDGRYLASGGEDRTVRIWDLSRPRQPIVLRGHPSILIGLAFSRDGRLLISSSMLDDELRVWDVATGQSRAAFNLPRPWYLVTCLEFSPDRETLLLGTDHGTVSFLNHATRREKAAIETHVGWVKSLGLTSDGKTLVTAGNDGSVRVWDVGKLSGR
jgi:WD40 repeat protein